MNEEINNKCETCEWYEWEEEECTCQCHTEQKNEEVQGVPV